MVERLDATADFTCVLEVERLVLPSAATRRFRSREAARLEVSVVDGRELFAWPGDAFEERPLTDLLGPGLASTGEFSSHGRTTFTDSRTRIERIAEAPAPGRAAYRYAVDQAASRYALVTEADNVLAAYQGVFHVDEETAQVTYFEVRVPQPPPQTGLARIANTVEYQQVDVGGRSTWLPSEARIEVESLQGPVARNQLAFRSCRSYQTETTIRFGTAREDAAQASGGGAAAVVIPAGIDLRITLRDTLSSDRAWAGDRFRAELYKAVELPGGERIPKGAEVLGRVVGLRTIGATEELSMQDQLRRSTTITLRLSEIRWAEGCAPVNATLELVERIPQMARSSPGGRVDTNGRFKSGNRAIAYETDPEMSDPGSGSFVVLGESYLIREGARMQWKTVPADATAACSDR